MIDVYFVLKMRENYSEALQIFLKKMIFPLIFFSDMIYFRIYFPFVSPTLSELRVGVYARP